MSSLVNVCLVGFELLSRIPQIAFHLDGSLNLGGVVLDNPIVGVDDGEHVSNALGLEQHHENARRVILVLVERADALVRTLALGGELRLELGDASIEFSNLGCKLLLAQDGIVVGIGT